MATKAKQAGANGSPVREVGTSVVTRLHAETTKVLQQPETKERFAGDGADPVGNSPEEFGRFVQSELVKWAKVARDAGIKPE